MKPLVTPTVNLNGTDQRDLTQWVVKVASALDAVLYQMRQATPHGRDYPTADEHFSRWGQEARDAWIERLRMIEELHKEVWALAMSIDNQGRDTKYLRSAGSRGGTH